MRRPNYHVLKIDEKSYGKTPSGLHYFTEGVDYDKYNFTAEMVIPMNDDYHVGQKVIASHFILDAKFRINDEVMRFAKDDEIFVHFDGDTPKSKQYILAEKLKQKKTALAFEMEEEIENVFKVVYSEFDFAEKGDEIAIVKDTDYPIAHTDIICLRPDYCMRNLTKEKNINDFKLIQPLTDEGFEKTEGGIYIQAKEVNKGWGLYNGQKVIFEKKDSYKLPDGNYMTKEILAYE